MGVFSNFWPTLSGPGGQTNKPCFHSSFACKPLIGFLAYPSPKLWLKNPILDKNTNVTQKVTSAISEQTLASHNSAAD